MKTKIKKFVKNFLNSMKAVEEPITFLDLIEKNDLLKFKKLDD